jgi:hypothetical protein
LSEIKVIKFANVLLENPKEHFKKGVLKRLKTRLQQRSPDDYRYEIKIASPKS